MATHPFIAALLEKDVPDGDFREFANKRLELRGFNVGQAVKWLFDTWEVISRAA